MEPRSAGPEALLVRGRFRYRGGEFRHLLPRILFWGGVVLVAAVGIIALVHTLAPPLNHVISLPP